jgi:hypothetical protein
VLLASDASLMMVIEPCSHRMSFRLSSKHWSLLNVGSSDSADAGEPANMNPQAPRSRATATAFRRELNAFIRVMNTRLFERSRATFEVVVDELVMIFSPNFQWSSSSPASWAVPANG